MAEQTSIEWCDATFNPWWGCEKVSPGCAHCYAETLSKRRQPGKILWGAGHEVRLFEDRHWDMPRVWARNLPAKLGRRPRVFCASMADVFEELSELDEHRARLFALISQTPELDWLILTKRAEFARDWMRDYYERLAGMALGVDRVPLAPGCEGLFNLWMGVSIENARFSYRADVLREIPAAVRFISAEPLLGRLVVDNLSTRTAKATSNGAKSSGGLSTTSRRSLDLASIDWLIIGGESGPGARPMRLTWAIELLEACREHGTAPLVKQLGAHLGSKLGAGAKGGEIEAFPEPLRVREFPQ